MAALGARRGVHTQQVQDKVLLKGLVFHGYHGVLDEVIDATYTPPRRTSSFAATAGTPLNILAGAGAAVGPKVPGGRHADN